MALALRRFRSSEGNRYGIILGNYLTCMLLALLLTPRNQSILGGSSDTLLYGLESKYYSLKPDHDKDFRIHDGIYLIGDGSGICRGLSQSGAMGLYAADRITKTTER